MARDIMPKLMPMISITAINSSSENPSCPLNFIHLENLNPRRQNRPNN